MNKTKIKVVFLDFDGVLNSDDSQNRCPSNVELDPFHVAFLNQITEATGAVIVLISSWRYALDAIPSLINAGATAEIKGCTPDLLGRRGQYWLTRCSEIEQWLSEHPEVSHYVVLDDLWIDAFKEIEDHVVHIAGNKGLGPQHVQDALKILTGTD